MRDSNQMMICQKINVGVVTVAGLVVAVGGSFFTAPSVVQAFTANLPTHHRHNKYDLSPLFAQTQTQQQEDSATTIMSSSGLQYIDLVVGSGRQPGKNDFVSVHYEGKQNV